MKETTKLSKKLKVLQSVVISDYLKNLHDSEKRLLLSKRHSDNFTYIEPSEEVRALINGEVQELLIDKDVNNTCNLSYFDVMSGVKDSYKLTKEDINLAYTFNLIVFEFGDTYISGKDFFDTIKFNNAFIEKIKQANRVRTLKNKIKIINHFNI